jgi:hypothetical protein
MLSCWFCVWTCSRKLGETTVVVSRQSKGVRTPHVFPHWVRIRHPVRFVADPLSSSAREVRRTIRIRRSDPIGEVTCRPCGEREGNFVGAVPPNPEFRHEPFADFIQHCRSGSLQCGERSCSDAASRGGRARTRRRAGPGCARPGSPRSACSGAGSACACARQVSDDRGDRFRRSRLPPHAGRHRLPTDSPDARVRRCQRLPTPRGSFASQAHGHGARHRTD